MLSNFFNKNILPFIIDGKKNYDSIINDLLFISLLVEKDIGSKPSSLVNFYKEMLGESLFHYKLTKLEYEFLVDNFKERVKSKSESSIVSIGILSRFHDYNINFMFDQLKKKLNNFMFSKEIINVLYSKNFPEYKKYLETILKNEGINIELKKIIEQKPKKDANWKKLESEVKFLKKQIFQRWEICFFKI